LASTFRAAKMRHSSSSPTAHRDAATAELPFERRVFARIHGARARVLARDNIGLVVPRLVSIDLVLRGFAVGVVDREAAAARTR